MSKPTKPMCLYVTDLPPVPAAELGVMSDFLGQKTSKQTLLSAYNLHLHEVRTLS